MKKCDVPKCTNDPKQTWKLSYGTIEFNHDLCDECANTIEFSEFSNSSFSNIIKT